jgi:glutathione S-transferase
MAASTKAIPGETLEVRRTFNAPRQRVFDAWTKAEEVKQWAGPGAMSVTHAEADLRVGGKYRIHLRNPNGSEHRAFGVYRVFEPPKKVVYTWTWETMPDVVDTLVTVEFHERGTATEVVLRHDGLTSDQRKPHEDGWLGCFAKFEHVVAAP